jgi:hypothetical protein
MRLTVKHPSTKGLPSLLFENGAPAPTLLQPDVPVGDGLWLMAAFLRSNGVIHRTRKVIQVDDNGHVGRPCEVSLAPPYQEPFASYGASAVTRTSGRGHVAEAKTNVIEVGRVLNQGFQRNPSHP